MANNLSQLKKALMAGAEFEIVGHCRPECVGQSRRVNIANTAGFYSGWSKARFWRFENGVCSLYDSDKEQTPEHLIIAFKLKEGAHGQSV